MLSRVAARVLTGPLAFLAAGVIDVGAFLLACGREALRRRLTAERPARPPG